MKIMHFEGLGLRHFSRGPFRIPKAGEYYGQAGRPATARKATAYSKFKSPRRIVTPIGRIVKR